MRGYSLTRAMSRLRRLPVRGRQGVRVNPSTRDPRGRDRSRGDCRWRAHAPDARDHDRHGAGCFLAVVRFRRRSLGSVARHGSSRRSSRPVRERSSSRTRTSRASSSHNCSPTTATGSFSGAGIRAVHLRRLPRPARKAVPSPLSEHRALPRPAHPRSLATAGLSR